MHAASDEELRAQIRAAWADAVRPSDEKICDTYDDEGVVAYFAGRSWDGHDVRSLRYHSVGLSFFLPEAFCYYLPAYLLAVLEDANAADVVYDGILYHLEPSQLGMQWADSYRARIDGFDEAQKEALVGYLEWCRARFEQAGGRGYAQIGDTITYLASGVVRSAETPVECLLQLGGERDQPPEEVTWLRLSHTTVADDDLAGLAAFRNLRELDLAGTSVSDAGLAHLSTLATSQALAKLTKLDLSNGTQFTAEGLVHLNALTALAELRLPNSELDDDKLAALDALALRSLNLVHCRALTDRGWAKLDVRRLEELSMYGVIGSDLLLTRLGEAGVIRKLTCGGVSRAGVIALATRAPRPALADLNLSDAGALGGPDASALAALAALPALRELQLGEVDLQTWPAGFPALVELKLLSGNLAAAAAAGLAALPALVELSCYGETFAAGAIAALAASGSLRRLTLSSKDLEDAHLLELAGSAIERLAVQRGPLGDAAFAVLAQLPRLTDLRLTDLPLSDAAVPHLAAAPALRALHLDGVPITDDGLAHLASCPALQTLHLAGTKVTRRGLAALKQARPSLQATEL